MIAGDFNQWKIGEAVGDLVDVREVFIGPTRGSRSIDRIFVNFSRSVVESGTSAPLETEVLENGRITRSDHRVAFCRTEFLKTEKFKWETYTCLLYTSPSPRDRQKSRMPSSA